VGGSAGEPTAPILWAKFEHLDDGFNRSQSQSLHENNLPLLLALGYATGIQVNIYINALCNMETF